MISATLRKFQNRNTIQQLKLMPQSKSKVLLLNARLLQRRKDSNIEVLILIGITGAAVIVIAIVVVMMGEFCGGLWLRPLSQDLFWARVLEYSLTCRTKDVT